MRNHKRTYLAIMVLLVAACTDDRVTRPQGTLTPRSPEADAIPAAGPTRVAFDAVVQESSAKSGATIRLHIDRTWTAASNWTTTIAIVDDPRLGTMPREKRRPSRVIAASDGSFQMFAADGTLLSLPDPNRMLPVAAGMSLPAAPTRRPSARAARISTAWIDAVVRTSADRARDVASAIGGASPAARDASGLDHYRKTVGDHVVDVAVDPVAHRIAAMVVDASAGDSRTIANEYVDVPSGLSVRRELTIRQASPKGTRSTVLSVSHVTIDGQDILP